MSESRANERTRTQRAERDKRRTKSKRRRSYKRIAAYAGAGGVICTVLLWIGIHQFPWLGPFVANTLRAVVGTENVTRLEDFSYAVEDRFNRLWKKNDKPKAYWSVPSASAKAKAPKTPAPKNAPPPLPPFAPPTPGPVHESWSAPGDGRWVPIVDPRHPDDDVRMMKTLLHPDKNRSWAELFVVALDLSRVDIHAVAGYQEPKSDKPEAEKYERVAKIPAKHHAALLAAFNGGFMTEHGGYGMKIDGITLVDPKDKGCTLAKFEDGSFAVAQWKNIKQREADMVWYRQAPNCMYERGEMHPLLRLENVRHWGATLDGETVIRRSAVGLNDAGNIMYVGISNHTNARVMAEGMRHAGATTVAQLDVNWSYPKFVLYEPKDGKLVAVALAEGFEFSEDIFIRERSMRDFFYVTRKPRGRQLDQVD